METNYINTPEGTRDRLFAECRDRRELEGRITGVFKRYDYSEVMTPEVEFYDMFAQSGNPLPQEALVKIVDKSGRLLVMRPDNTTPIARAAASRLTLEGRAQRLYYNQSVFRSSDAHNGVESEISQCGIELIGADGIDADVEVLVIAMETLETAGAGDFYIELGHAGLYKALSAELRADRETSEKIRSYIEKKNFAALKELLKSYDCPAARALDRIGHLYGGAEVLEEAKTLLPSEETEAIAYLKALYNVLESRGYGDHVRFDLGMVHQIDYYTGVVFRGYVHGAAANVLSGGRYDNLLSFFGADSPATGFAVNTGAVLDALKDESAASNGRLRIAITKGRLLDKSIDMFEKMGLDCGVVKDPGRKLVAEIGNYGLDVVMSKAPDVVTYVEHGVCDMGIVGKDTILESGSSFYEVLDLGFGKCRFALAVKEGTDFYNTYKTRIVASKYPNVAKRYFASKGMDVTVIKIEGSVELAPILGLADGIVDIVETGSTLKANGLIPIETIHEISARLIVNTASMKLHKEEILDFLEKCEQAIQND